jgi:hypothetical protein
MTSRVMYGREKGGGGGEGKAQRNAHQDKNENIQRPFIVIRRCVGIALSQYNSEQAIKDPMMISSAHSSLNSPYGEEQSCKRKIVSAML